MVAAGHAVGCLVPVTGSRHCSGPTPRTYVGSVERGKRNISLPNIVLLAQALSVDCAMLVAGLKP